MRAANETLEDVRRGNERLEDILVQMQEQRMLAEAETLRRADETMAQVRARRDATTDPEEVRRFDRLLEQMQDVRQRMVADPVFAMDFAKLQYEARPRPRSPSPEPYVPIDFTRLNAVAERLFNSAAEQDARALDDAVARERAECAAEIERMRAVFASEVATHQKAMQEFVRSGPCFMCEFLGQTPVAAPEFRTHPRDGVSQLVPLCPEHVPEEGGTFIFNYVPSLCYKVEYHDAQGEVHGMSYLALRSDITGVPTRVYTEQLFNHGAKAESAATPHRRWFVRGDKDDTVTMRGSEHVDGSSLDEWPQGRAQRIVMVDGIPRTTEVPGPRGPFSVPTWIKKAKI